MSHVGWITERLAVGGFPDLPTLERERVNGVLNLCGAPPSYGEGKTARAIQVVWLPTLDAPHTLTPATARVRLLALDELLRRDKARVLVHCSAGQNRSPAICYLYLIASGMAPDAAEDAIAEVAYDAVPRRLVPPELAAWAPKVGDLVSPESKGSR